MTPGEIIYEAIRCSEEDAGAAEDAIRAALTDGTLSPADLGMEPMEVFTSQEGQMQEVRTTWVTP